MTIEYPAVGDTEAQALNTLAYVCSQTSILKGFGPPVAPPAAEIQLTDAPNELRAYVRSLEDRVRQTSPVVAQMLMVTEIAEACEALRKNVEHDDKVPQLTGEEAEIADVAIRLFDYCGRRNINIGRAVQLKQRFNTTRPHKHGKKF